MRRLLLFLILAGAVAAAALVQNGTLAKLRQGKRAADDVAEGLAAPTEVGLVRAGHAVVTIGRPALAEAEQARPGNGAPPSFEPPRPALRQVSPAAAGDSAQGDVVLGDFELVVQAGETLSQIAHRHYGSHRRALLDGLARYNGLADVDALQAGARLKLPSPEALEALQER